MGSVIIPAIRYKDAAAAIEWLCKAFDFKKMAAFEHEGVIVHAQLTYGNGMIMLGTARADTFDQYQKLPLETGGFVTQSPFIVVDDVEAHYKKAVENGAEIVIEMKQEPHGKGYTCCDPEGHIWNFGNYNPWNTKA